MDEEVTRSLSSANGRAPTALDEVLLVGGTLVYGVLLQRVIPEKWHVPANIAAALVSIGAARRAGASAADCGLGGNGTALRASAAAAAAIGAVLAIAAVPERTRRLFSDDRISAHDSRRACYEVLVRIPLGTAASEEVVFRGAMLGVMLRRHSTLAAIARASVCFGVWHVFPTLTSLRSSLLGHQVRGKVPAAAAVTGVVLVTAVAGAGFAVLRLRSRSVAAPALAHAALNAMAYLVARRAGRDPAQVRN